MTRSELRALVTATGCAIERGEQVFLCDPHWSESERREAERLMAAAVADPSSSVRPPPADPGWLAIRTGGSGGGVKFARHDEHTLTAAAAGFARHFGLERVNAVDVLPPYHVSGLMARVRCAVTGGSHVAWNWKQLEAGGFPQLGAGSASAVRPSLADAWVLSLVPTQLQRLLAAPAAVEWLRGFAVIFLGGGPTWPELADAAARAGLRVSLSYGMTETAAMVAALRPEEFLAGARSCGAPLPHARVSVNAEGRVVVGGESLFRGYVGAAEPQRGEFVTNDLGRIDARGHLHVLGRADAVIITGGKKVQPVEVEAALRASGEFADVVVLGVPDAEWGEAVVACYPAAHGARKIDVARAVETLAPQQRPKRFVAVPAEEWPRNAQGKIDRVKLAGRLNAERGFNAEDGESAGRCGQEEARGGQA